jgi:hypothetical protein
LGGSSIGFVGIGSGSCTDEQVMTREHYSAIGAANRWRNKKTKEGLCPGYGQRNALVHMVLTLLSFAGNPVLAY